MPDTGGGQSGGVLGGQKFVVRGGDSLHAGTIPFPPGQEAAEPGWTLLHVGSRHVWVWGWDNLPSD